MAARKKVTAKTTKAKRSPRRVAQPVAEQYPQTPQPMYYPQPQQPSNLSKFLVPVLGILLIGTSFMVGVLWTKLSAAENGGGACGSKPLSGECLKSYAKEIKTGKKKFLVFNETLANAQFEQCVDSRKYRDQVNADIAQGVQVGVTGTPATFINGHLVSGAQPYEVFRRAIDYVLAGGDLAKPDASMRDLIIPAGSAPGTSTGSVSGTKMNIDLGNAPFMGKADAPVTLVEYSDFECPFCQRFFSQTLGEIKENYVDTGKVKFVYKQFPLTTIHPNAQAAAEASLCAHEQGQFWPYHDKMFTAASEANN